MSCPYLERGNPTLFRLLLFGKENSDEGDQPSSPGGQAEGILSGYSLGEKD